MSEDTSLGTIMFWGAVIVFCIWAFWGDDSGTESMKEAAETDITYYNDPLDEYEYNYRTGVSGTYEYNYDVTGTDAYGNYVDGSVETSGKYGEGYVYDENGNEVYVETEWVDYGVIEATDEYGNTYELETY